MKSLLKTNLFLPFFLIVSLAAAGCDFFHGDDADRATTYGPAQALGNGSVRSYVTLDDGEPTAIGLTFSEAALTNLPAGNEHGTHEVVLALPAETAVAPYNHISFDWNPQGHEPPGVYDRPHFDIHFYMISEAERDAITPTDPDFEAKSNKQPAAQYVPAGYVQTPGGIPRMGAHWVDPTSPEFTEDGFSRTFIYGFWDGHMAFLEPMITKAFIESVKASQDQTVSFPIPQPPAVEKPGYYPAQYSVRYDARAKTYTIALEGLKRR